MPPNIVCASCRDKDDGPPGGTAAARPRSRVDAVTFNKKTSPAGGLFGFLLGVEQRVGTAGFEPATP